MSCGKEPNYGDVEMSRHTEVAHAEWSRYVVAPRLGAEGDIVRILVVDDDAEIRDMLRRLLEADDYQVEAVSTAPDALAAVVREEPDLVLLDVVLDTEDGRDLLKEMRLICDLPVVFLTGRGSEIDKVSGLKMGADDYIVKPFSPGELSARVRIDSSTNTAQGSGDPGSEFRHGAGGFVD